MESVKDAGCYSSCWEYTYGAEKEKYPISLFSRSLCTRRKYVDDKQNKKGNYKIA